MSTKAYSSVEKLIKAVSADHREWNSSSKPWFRGEPNLESTQLTPKLYRPDYLHLKEIDLLRKFRNRAPLFVDYQIPQQGHTDDWLFLAQHSGLPTRLLDWTESLLVALYFAINHDHKNGGVVWMLEPVRLNRLTAKRDNAIDDPLTWYVPELDPVSWLIYFIRPDERTNMEHLDYDFSSDFQDRFAHGRINRNIGSMNIRAAWEANESLGTKYPVALNPTYIHPRINQQLSRFTIWGQDKNNLSKMEGMDANVLRMYRISSDGSTLNEIRRTLSLLGLSRASLFPELDSLASDIARTY